MFVLQLNCRFMSFLSPIFDANYRYPLAKESDPDRKLSRRMRIKILFSSPGIWISLFAFIFCAVLLLITEDSQWSIRIFMLLMFPVMIINLIIVSFKMTSQEIILLKHGCISQAAIYARN
jgi:hypothetical protein